MLGQKLEKNKSNICKMDVFLIVLFSVLIGANSGTHDYNSYFYSYEGITSPAFETGYKWIENFFGTIGFSFDVFKLVVFAFSIFSISIIAKKYHANLLFVFILYFLYPLPLDAAAIRSTLAKSVFYLSFLLLDIKGKSLNVFLLVGLLLLSSLFHVSMLIYVIPVVVFLLYNSNSTKGKLLLKLLAVLTIIIGTVSAFYRPFLYALITILTNSSLFENEKSIYLVILGNWGFIFYGIIQTVYLYVLYLVRLQLVELSSTSVIDKSEYKAVYSFVTALLVFGITLLALLPIYRMNSNYFRFFRNLIPMIYVAVSYVLNKRNSVNNNRTYTILFCTISTTMFVFAVDVLSEKKILWDTLFSNNWIFNNIFKK